MKKYFNWLTVDLLKNVAIVCLVIVVAYIGLSDFKVPTVKTEKTVSVEALEKAIDKETKEIEKKEVDEGKNLEAKTLIPKETKEPVVCPPSKTAIVLESKDDLLKNKKWFVVDLNDFEVTKVKKTKEDITVYYRLLGKSKTYVTVTEKRNNLNYTKDYE